LDIQENFSLLAYNTFGVDVKCDFFTKVTSKEQLRAFLTSEIVKANKVLIIGGGSNILFTKNYSGLIIHNLIKGIELSEETESDVLVTAGSGEEWHDLVKFAIDNNLGGIENLSLIPGYVGAAPIQNIGAYGVELRETLIYVETVEIKTGELRTFNNSQCNFGYRDSIFKREAKDKYVITKVALRLSKNSQVNINYGAIKSKLEARAINDPTIRDVSDAIIEIRQSKLPDPKVIGNAGSFFKNPVIDKIDYEGLKLSFPDIPGYFSENTVKIPAAWLIEQCGWKGKKIGKIGVHIDQPLVLVNYGGGMGDELLELASNIKQSVVEKFGIELENEPKII
jgi:UDP-N-acetylmuramate dehydrogenase